MSNVGLVVALHSEVPLLFRDIAIVHLLNNNSIKVVVSGIGQKKAGKKTEKLCEKHEDFSPDYLINLGFCGAIKDELKIGDLVIADRLCYNGQEIQLENIYIDRLKEFIQGTKYHEGKLQTFNWPVFSRSRVCEDTMAVDMESFAIAKTCIKFQMPVIIVKVVSDIVPPKLSVINLWHQIKGLIKNKSQVQSQLNEFATKYFNETD